MIAGIPPGVGVKWGYRDDMGMMGTMWGPQGPHHDKHVHSHLQFIYMCMHVWGAPSPSETPNLPAPPASSLRARGLKSVKMQ